MMESIEKLREKIRLDVNNPWSDLKGDLLAMCDKVETELAERYMELPLDADGVPIHVGETCYDTDTAEPFEVSSIEWNGICWSAWSKPEKRHIYNHVTHVKPRTLEDVLREYASKMNDAYNSPYIGGEDRADELSTITEDVAAEIRELLGVEK